MARIRIEIDADSAADLLDALAALAPSRGHAFAVHMHPPGAMDHDDSDGEESDLVELTPEGAEAAAREAVAAFEAARTAADALEGAEAAAPADGAKRKRGRPPGSGKAKAAPLERADGSAPVDVPGVHQTHQVPGDVAPAPALPDPIASAEQHAAADAAQAAEIMSEARHVASALMQARPLEAAVVAARCRAAVHDLTGSELFDSVKDSATAREAFRRVKAICDEIATTRTPAL